MKHSNYRENYAPDAIYGPYEREHADTKDMVYLWVSGFAWGFIVAYLCFA